MTHKCPYCNGTLEKGKASIDGTTFGFIFYGFSHKNLYFKSESGKETMILGNSETTPALRCENCGIVILHKEFYTPNVRENVVDFLTVCSSDKLLEKSFENITDVSIHEEIASSWKILYLPKQNNFAKCFSENELQALSAFDDFIDSKDWDKLETSAEKALNALIDLLK